MQQTNYSPTMKMADLIHANYINLLVINRFGIHLGFGDKTVAEVCERATVNTELLLLVCTIFHNHGYEPQHAEIEKCPIIQVVIFLQNSHHYYLGVQLPEIHKALNTLLATCSPQHGKALTTFFEEYTGEIEKHLAYEDKYVFPYVLDLIHKKRDTKFSIQQFEDKHDDIESKLNDLKNIIIKYMPEADNDILRNQLLEKLFLFEEDLNRHIHIEDKLLVPSVLLLEKNTK